MFMNNVVLQCLRSRGDIKSSYILKGHRQVGSTACPGTTLYNAIKSWPRWVIFLIITAMGIISVNFFSEGLMQHNQRKESQKIKFMVQNCHKYGISGRNSSLNLPFNKFLKIGSFIMASHCFAQRVLKF